MPETAQSTTQSDELVSLTTQTDDVVARATNLIIADDGGVEIAGNWLKDIGTLKKFIEDRRTFFVKPLNDQVKRINAEFKKLTDPLADADMTIRRKISQYRFEVQEKARKEQERLRREAEAEQKRQNELAALNNVEAPKVETPVVAPPPTKVGGVSMRKVWKFVVLKQAEVPAQYLMVDEAAIRKAVSEGVREIPGVHIYEEEIPVIR